MKDFLKSIMNLFRDKDSQNMLSKGAILLWITFGILCYFWIMYANMLACENPPKEIPDAPQSLETVFTLLLGYLILPKRGQMAELMRKIFDKGNTINNNVVNNNESKDN